MEHSSSTDCGVMRISMDSSLSRNNVFFPYTPKVAWIRTVGHALWKRYSGVPQLRREIPSDWSQWKDLVEETNGGHGCQGQQSRQGSWVDVWTIVFHLNSHHEILLLWTAVNSLVSSANFWVFLFLFATVFWRSWFLESWKIKFQWKYVLVVPMKKGWTKDAKFRSKNANCQFSMAYLFLWRTKVRDNKIKLCDRELLH